MTRWIVGEMIGVPHARVRAKRENGFVVVERGDSTGAYDWFTYHLTRWGARRAADLYERKGEVRGLRP